MRVETRLKHEDFKKLIAHLHSDGNKGNGSSQSFRLESATQESVNPSDSDAYKVTVASTKGVEHVPSYKNLLAFLSEMEYY